MSRYVADLQASDERIERLFAYGTLQPDRLRWPFLAPFVVAYRPAFVDGTLTAGDRAWTYHCDHAPDAMVRIARWTGVDER